MRGNRCPRVVVEHSQLRSCINSCGKARPQTQADGDFQFFRPPRRRAQFTARPIEAAHARAHLAAANHEMELLGAILHTRTRCERENGKPTLRRIEPPQSLQVDSPPRVISSSTYAHLCGAIPCKKCPRTRVSLSLVHFLLDHFITSSQSPAREPCFSPADYFLKITTCPRG